MVKLNPFVKWVGGKRQLLAQLKTGLPHYNVYHEPFLGGGALFFDLAPQRAFISDTNPHLVNTYQAIKYSVDKLIELLNFHGNNSSKEYYYSLREQHSLDDPVERAARFIYLNKMCFNGLYRENSKGLFNAAWGYRASLVVDYENLRAISDYLQNTDITIATQPYTWIEENVKEGDLVYFDPPYDKLNDASFTLYNKNVFGQQDQKQLSQLAERLRGRGVYILASNANTEFVKQIWSEFAITPVTAVRRINSNSKQRGRDEIEVIIRSW